MSAAQTAHDRLVTAAGSKRGLPTARDGVKAPLRLMSPAPTDNVPETGGPLVARSTGSGPPVCGSIGGTFTAWLGTHLHSHYKVRCPGSVHTAPPLRSARRACFAPTYLLPR